MSAYNSVAEVEGAGAYVALSKSRAMLRFLLRKYWPKESFNLYRKHVSRFVEKKGVVSERDILRCWLREGDARGTVELKERFFYAVLYYEAAVSRLAEGRAEASAVLAMRSALEIGRFDGMQNFMSVVNLAYNGRVLGAKVGKKIREDIYEMLAELLVLSPANPWRSYSEAANTLSKALSEYVDTNWISLDLDIYEFIITSIERKGKVRDHYFRHALKGRDVSCPNCDEVFRVEP